MFSRAPACLCLALLLTATPASGQVSASGDLATLLRDATTAYLAGDRDRAVAVLETVRTRAQAEGAPLIEAEARRHLGSAYLALEQFDRAFDELTRARTLYAAAGDRPLEAQCVLALANLRRSQNQPAEALALARTAAAAFKDLGDDRRFVDAAEVVVYLLPDDADHDPIRSEALAVVDGQGRPTRLRRPARVGRRPVPAQSRRRSLHRARRRARLFPSPGRARP